MARFRNICFTVNNPAENYAEKVVKLPYKYCVFQIERSEAGTTHIQGYAELSKRQSLRQLHKIIPGAHIEARRGTAVQAANYCKKDDTRVEGPWEYGEISRQGKRSDLTVVIDDIEKGESVRDIAMAYPLQYIKYHRGIEKLHALTHAADTWNEERVCKWIWGPPGVGKTRQVVENEADLFVMPVGGCKWFDGYTGQPAALIDDVDSDTVNLQMFLRIADRYKVTVPIKGGFVDWKVQRLYITSNESPKEIFSMHSKVRLAALLRRFDVVKLA